MTSYTGVVGPLMQTYQTDDPSGMMRMVFHLLMLSELYGR